MILKSYEIKKIEINKVKIVLFYGQNHGAKKEAIFEILKNNKNTSVIKYDEKEFLNNSEITFESILSKSLFDDKKILIINRASEKILKSVNYLSEKDLNDILIIIETDNLEKKSKLRSLFEKDKEFICVPFYPDNDQTLTKIAAKFFKEKEISISSLNINLIVSKCNGDRGILINELNKIENYTNNGKRITTESIYKLTNLIENISVIELVDNCLAKNGKKIINILNENNYSNEDSILILRTFINKTKKILKLSNEYQKNGDIELTISTARPPIFWKEKEITKQQIYKSTPESLKNLIYDLNELELLVKKNINNSINLLNDFILKRSSVETNN